MKTNPAFSNRAGRLTTAWASMLLPLLWLLGLPAAVEAQYSYLITNGTITITGYSGPGGDVTIPPLISGLPVTALGESALSNCVSLTSITLPDSVASIGDYAFYNCTSLTRITLPNRVATVGDYAFTACLSLTNVTLPDAIANLGNYVFFDCVSLPSVTLPNSVTNLGDSAFGLCFCLTSVTIPDHVTTIGSGAFRSCWCLTNATIGANVTSIGDDVFDGCLHLPSITLPNSVTNVGPLAFLSCSSLASATIGTNVTTIGDSAFASCTSLTNVTIPNSVTAIGNSVFQECVSLSIVTLPKRVTAIGDDAFRGCTSLSSVFFQGDAPSADSSVFYGDSDVTVYYLPGTTGWGTTFADLPTRLWQPVTILMPPLTQTAEVGTTPELRVDATNTLPGVIDYQWYFSGTNTLKSATNSLLELTNVQPTQAGVYNVVVSNPAGAVTSAPAFLGVIPPVDRSLVAAVQLTGGNGSLLYLDYADVLRDPTWLPLSNVTLTAGPQFYFDLTQPLPSQRFYRAWQATGPPPLLNLSFATEIPLAGTVGSSVRVDYINQFGPTNAWVTLATVTLTNSPQLYFDTTAFRQVPRLYRLVSGP